MSNEFIFSSGLLNKQAKLFNLSVQKTSEPIFQEELTLSKTGQPVLYINGIWLHSKYDPQKESSRLIQSIKPSHDEQIVIFFGAGLGYSVIEFCKLWPNSIYWIELDLEVQLCALATLNFESYKNKITLLNSITFLDDTPDLINQQLSDTRMQEMTKGRVNDDILFISHRSSYLLNPAYGMMQKSFENHINKKSVNMTTMSKFDRLWGHNLIRNFPALSQAKPVSLLFDTLTGGSALICGAGPSLENDIEKIREFANTCTLICVDTALRILECHDIFPDIILCVDPQSINQYYLEFIKSTQACFVVEPTTSPLCLRHIPKNRLYFMESPFSLSSLLNDAFESEIGKISYGGSVSTNAYDLAIQMGCTDILLFGHDFSFSKKKAHSKGAILEDRLNYQENRFKRREEHNYRQLSALPVRYVIGKDSQKIPTNDKLIIFLQWFEKRIQEDQKKGIHVYDLKSQGADLGIAKKDLQHWRKQKKKILATKNIITFDLNNFLKLMHECIIGLESVKNISSESSVITTELIAGWKKDNKSQNFNQKLHRLDELDKKLHSLDSFSNIAGSLIQRTIYSITELDSKTNTKSQSSPAHPDTLKKSMELYEGLNIASKDLIHWLEKSIKQIVP